jgi:hypothetical protein
VGVYGLMELMKEFKEQGREPSNEVAEEILKRLEVRNYIPSSEKVRREYSYVLLREYKRFFKSE